MPVIESAEQALWRAQGLRPCAGCVGVPHIQFSPFPTRHALSPLKGRGPGGEPVREALRKVLNLMPSEVREG